MAKTEFPSIDVAVALILDDAKQKFLWIWNPRWRAFSLPKSQVRLYSGIEGTHALAAREAAERAGAEALGVPVVVHHARQLSPILERSGRDGQLKSYRYEAFRVSPHDQFADRVHLHQPHIWLAGHEALSGDFCPLAASSVKVMGQLVEAGLVPGRRQLASTVLVTRSVDEAVEYLMHFNPDWGYSFPGKRRGDGEPAMSAAERVATQELGLEPGATVTLRQVSPEPLTYHDRSDSTEVDTFYVHTVFTATPSMGATMKPIGEMAWVPLADIVAGRTDAPNTPQGKIGRAGQVSRTARRILEFVGRS